MVIALAAGLVPALASAGPQADTAPSGWLAYGYERPLTANFGKARDLVASSTSELCARDVASGRQLRVVTSSDGAAGAGGPAWSRDGSQLAFTQGYHSSLGSGSRIALKRNGARTSVALPPAQRTASRVVARRPDDRLPQPDQEVDRLVDVSTRQVTQVPGVFPYVFSPSWSPDGRRLVFAAQLVPGGQIQVAVYDFDKRATTDLTPGLPTGADPAWSPDGLAIAFSAVHDGKAGIAVIDADGTDLRMLTDSKLGDREPAWSPDSRWIAFGRSDGSLHAGLGRQWAGVSVRAAGTRLRPLLGVAQHASPPR